MIEVTTDSAERVRGWRDVNVVKDLEYVHRHSAIPGVFIVEAMHPCWGVPVGIAYYREEYDCSISLLYINVVEQLRRMGIGRAIIEAIQRERPRQTIVTAMATELAKPFLPKAGFAAPNEERQFWVRPS